MHLHWGQSKYKNKVYKSYSLAKAFRKDGKNRREVFLSLGKLSDEEAARWRIFLKAIKSPDAILTTFEDINIIEKYSYLDLSVVKNIWEEWELGKPFQRKSNAFIDLSTIALILTINRSLQPLSKQQVSSWVKKTWLSKMYDFSEEQLNSARIFRELDNIEDCKDAICKHLHRQLRRRFPASMQEVFYDLSSATFSGTKCILMGWGRCKEGYQNHVVLALVVNQYGMPFYWEVLEGNTADSKTIAWLLKKLKRLFPDLNTTLVFDRGMVSDDNLIMLTGDGYKYISALDKNQIESITDFDFKKYSYFEVEKIVTQIGRTKEFKKLNDTTYYREAGVVNNRRYILCFNPQLFKDQRKSRDVTIENFVSYVRKMN